MKTPKNKGKWPASTEMLCQSSRGQPTSAKQRAPGQGEALPSDGVTLPGRPTRCAQLPTSTHRPCASSCPGMPSVHIGSCPASCRLTLCGGLRRCNSAHSPSTPFEPGQKQSPRYDPVGGLQQAPERSRLGIAPGSPPSGCQRLREPRASLGLRYRIRAVFIHLTGSPSIHIDAFKRVVHSSSTPAKSVVLPHPHMSPRKTSPFVANR